MGGSAPAPINENDVVQWLIPGSTNRATIHSQAGSGGLFRLGFRLGESGQFVVDHFSGNGYSLLVMRHVFMSTNNKASVGLKVVGSLTVGEDIVV